MGTRTATAAPEQQDPWTVPLRLLWLLPQWGLSLGPRCARRQAETSARVVGAAAGWAIRRLTEAYKNSPLGDEELKEIIREVNRIKRERGHVDFW